MRSLGFALAASLAFCATAVPASAESEAARACLAAHVAVQEKRIAGDLLGARQSASVCADDVCPALPRAECARWADDVARELPTVTVSARGGSPGAKLRVTIDGAEHPADIAVALNPGHHSIEVSDGVSSAQRSIRLVLEQRAAIAIDLGAPPGSASGRGPTQTRLEDPPPPALGGPIAFGAVGVAAFVAFGVAAGLGASSYADLESKCAPRCTRAETDSVDEKLVAADVALGIGSAALAGGVIWLAVELAGASSDTTSPSARGLVVQF